MWTLVPIEGASDALRAAKEARAEAWDVLRCREAHGWPCRQVFTPVNSIDLLGYKPEARRWWVFELKRGRSADRVVGQVSRYLGWIGEERRGNRETAVGAIIVRKADPKLRYAVKANERLSLGEFDEQLQVKRVA